MYKIDRRGGSKKRILGQTRGVQKSFTRTDYLGSNSFCYFVVKSFPTIQKVIL